MHRIICSLVVTAVVVGSAGLASASPISSFHACTAFTATAARCYDDAPVAVEAGGRVDLRARIRPAHAGERANLVRIVPPGNRWVQFASATIGPNGRVHFLWHTQVSDIRNRDYRFQWRVPRHGTRSNVLGVAVTNSIE